MKEVFIFTLFLADAAIVAVAAWLALCAAGGKTNGRIEPLLGWGLMLVAVVAGSGVGLGFIGALGPAGFLVAHAALLGLLGFWRRGSWRGDLAAGLEWFSDLRRMLMEPDWPARGAAGLGLLVLTLAALAAAAEPAVLDVITYRLPRIALWLDEGRIFHFAAADPRLDYMPWVPDLCAVWLLGATTGGWPLVSLVQTFGGALLLAATLGLARQAGLGRGAALGAAALVLGLANVAVQFTTAQTDLFTAGVLAAAFCLWQAALRRREGSVIGGLGAALALGSKGTVFYAAPGLLLLVGYLLWQHRPGWREWRRTLGGAAVGVMLWVLPAGAMNLATFGGVFGPAEAVRLHHGEPGLGFTNRTKKLWLNLRSSAVQLFDPHAQPAGLRSPARAAGLALLPDAADDPYEFEQFNRRQALAAVMGYPSPDVDVLSCGVLAVGAFLLAAGTLLVRRPVTAGRRLVLAGALVVIGYVLCEHAVVQWHVWAFRFMVLVAPWWAVTVAAGLEASPRRLRVAGWVVLLAASGSVFWHVTTRTPQAGWLALARPEGAPARIIPQAWRDWSRTLGPAGSPLRVALEHNRPLAAFLRQLPPRTVRLMRPPADPSITAEAMTAGQPGWLLVPLQRFIGREGRVQVRTWINPGPEGDDCSLAAYRSLAPGENPFPVLYRNQRTDAAGNIRRSLLVRTWDSGPVGLQFFNPRPEACRWLVITPTQEYRGEVAAGGTAETELPLPADALTELLVLFSGPPGGPAPVVALRVSPAAPTGP